MTSSKSGAATESSLAPIAADANTGEVFTRKWVVESILDLVGYIPERDLGPSLIVEPACGVGAFLGPIAQRLSASLLHHGRSLEEAADALRSWDLKAANVEISRQVVTNILLSDGWNQAGVLNITRHWIQEGDFLLASHQYGTADYVVGNPPYVRLEELPADRLQAYRDACSTMGGRADLYVGFFEHGLRLLKPGAKLGYICADRWMKNDYGRRLRKMIVDDYSVDATIVMHDVDAFEASVSAYPAISILRNGSQGKVVIADTTSAFEGSSADKFVQFALNPRSSKKKEATFEAARLSGWYAVEDSWPWASPERLALLEDLNHRFCPLEDSASGTRVGIGVATGRDSVYVVDGADIEKERLLPLATGQDIKTGRLTWSGKYLVNPWDETGLISLAEYPRFAAYMEANRSDVAGRAIAKKNDHAWYRTIDRVDMKLTGREKLLFPDMKMTTHPVFDPGGLYPHHNLYYIVSEGWDLRVLGGLLLSQVAEFFVDCYCVKMRGGTLRFQAQYLRRIRVPRPEQIPTPLAKKLRDAFDGRNVKSATEASLTVYGIDRIPE